MKHKMWFDNDSKILYLEFMGDYLKYDVPVIQEKMIELLEGKPFRQMIIIVSNIYKVSDSETRGLSKQALQIARITDAAFVGGSPANRMFAKVLLIDDALKTKSSFFKNSEDAIGWLKNRRQKY